MSDTSSHRASNEVPTPEADHASPTASDLEPGNDRMAPEPAWQRMSPKFIIVGTLRNLRGLIFPAAFLLVTGGGPRGDSRQQLVYLVIGLVIALVAALLSLLEWRFFRYAFTDRELVVRSGVFQKQERVVPFGRIQAINIEEAPLERLLGIVRLKVETAAGGAADVKIAALEQGNAHRLREELATARARAQGGNAGSASSTGPAASDSTTGAAVDPAAALRSSEDELIRRLSTPELLALGATSGRIGPAAAVAGALLQFGAELFPDSWWDRVPWQQAEALTNIGIAVTFLIVIAIIAWLMAIGSTALTFGGFELRRSGDQLLVQHGLLDRRRTTIPIQRIQAIIVGEQILRQPFHYADIRFESAGGSAGEGGSQGDSGVLFPYLPMREIQGVLRQAAPELATSPDIAMTTRLPKRALRRYVVSATVGWVIFVAILMAVLGFWADRWIDQVSWRQLSLLLLAIPVFALLGWARWRDGGWTVDSSLLLMRWRTVSRETMITRTARIQHRMLISDAFQRRVDLATVRVSVASGGIGGHFALPHADEDDAERLIAQLGGPRHNIEIRKAPVQAE